jgi:hypothetical protein
MSPSRIMALKVKDRTGHGRRNVGVGSLWTGHVIQAPKPESRIMRYELTDYE